MSLSTLSGPRTCAPSDWACLRIGACAERVQCWSASTAARGSQSMRSMHYSSAGSHINDMFTVTQSLPALLPS
jgi:hypothetical protein